MLTQSGPYHVEQSSGETLVHHTLINMIAYFKQTDNILYQKCGFPYKDLLIAVAYNCIHILIVIAIFGNLLLKCTIDIIAIHSVVPVMLKYKRVLLNNFTLNIPN